MKYFVVGIIAVGIIFAGMAQNAEAQCELLKTLIEI